MDSQTIKAYNNFAEQYDQETVDFWERFPKTFFDYFINASSKKILDVGCGPGRDGLILKQNSKEVVCIDASEEMVRLARTRGLDAEVADFLNLPFDNNSFDGVWAYTSLLHVSKEQITFALQEVRRVLKPKGIFGIGMIEGDKQEYRTSTKVSEPRLFSFYSRQELEKLLADNNFEILYSEEFKPNKKNYLNYICKNNK